MTAGAGSSGDGEGGNAGAARLRELEERIAALRARMEEGLPARARELRDAAARLATDPGARDEIRRAAHKLRGVAATHGHAELGEQAAAVEAEARDGTSLHALTASAGALADAIDSAATSRPARPARARAATGPKRLLETTIAAVDDDDATRRLLTLTLGPLGGATVHVVETPAALYELLRAVRVDLVVVDAMMPEATGLDVILALRAAHPDVEMRFAVLSASTEAELDWALDPEIRVTWLRKPFRPSELVDAIATLLGR